MKNQEENKVKKMRIFIPYYEKEEHVCFYFGLMLLVVYLITNKIKHKKK